MTKEKPVKVANALWNYKGVSVKADKRWYKPSRHEKGYYLTTSLLLFKTESGDLFSLGNVSGGIRNAVKIIDRAEATGELYKNKLYAPIKVARNGDNWEKID